MTKPGFCVRIAQVALIAIAVLIRAPTVAATDSAAAAARPADAWVTLKTDPYPGKRDDIFFADPVHGWYGTGKGDLYASHDGGQTWAKIASKPGTFIRALGFADSRLGFIGNVGVGYYPGVTDTVPLYRTSDGGVTWTPVDLHGAVVAGICAIDVLHTRRIYQGELQPHVMITAAGRVGGPAALIQSRDDGATWRVVDMSRWTSMILDVHFIDEQTGFIAGSSSTNVAATNAQILMTRDGGTTWTEVYRSKRPTELIWKLSFPSQGAAYGTVMSYDQANPHKVIVKSTDAGRSWRELPLVENGAAVELGLGFVDALHGWVGTTVGGFETRDGGLSFAPTNIAPAANKFRLVHEPDGAEDVYVIGTQVQRLELKGPAKP